MTSESGQMHKEPTHGQYQRWLLALIATGVVLVLLVQGRFFLVPLAIAIILFILTSAAIDFVARVRIGSFAVPNWLATIVAVLMIAAILLSIFGLVSVQTNAVVTTAANYTERGQEAVAALFAWIGEDVAQAVLAAFEDIDIGAYLRAAAGSAGNLLAAIILVILYVGFLFAERPWFGSKLARLFPDPHKAAEVGRMFLTIRRAVQHYILVKTAVSLATALVVYVILILFGLDFATALAVFTFVLNFIPNIGSIVATLLPALVALVQFGDWWPALLVLISVGVVQFSIGNVLDPLLLGRTLHLSSFAIILSLTFWGAVWGILGLFLAVPIMVMVMIVCAQIPGLRPFAIMLSREGTIIGEDNGAPADVPGRAPGE